MSKKLVIFNETSKTKDLLNIVSGSNINIDIDDEDITFNAMMEADTYYKFEVPFTRVSANEIVYETTQIPEGIYEVNVFVGIREVDISESEVNVGIIQQLEIWDETPGISNYIILGASHILNYTGTAEGEYKLINRHLQGSAIITTRNDPENKFKIKVTLPNHTLTGFGEVTGGYIHAKKLIN